MTGYATDYLEFLDHARAADLALTGILGDELADDDREQMERCADDLTGIITRVSKVLDHKYPRHSDTSDR